MNPAHLDYDVLADLAEGLLEDDEAASVNAHLDTCADCRELSADLADVSRILAEAPVPSMPAELAERIDTAIAAESMHTATVVSLEQRRGRRHWRILSAAAAAVIVVGGGATVGKIALDGANGTDGAAQHPAQDRASGEAPPGVNPKVAAPEPAFKVAHSGTDYRPGTLGDQVGQVIGGEQELRASAAPPDARLRGCVTSVANKQSLQLVDQAKYDGKPAIVIAVKGDKPGKHNIWVVGPDCTAQNHHLLKKLTNA
ncbi:anti-sigma factor family protein [Actinomadura madurae]|uniref:anti-sigma factor family protein n=1 Tax=Actinomadura madurae TaxID=1993 RepID=UPI0020265E98|nr:zf-HC2 domain-containing protein [Actinomadura madurae]MCP9952211.1 zf-HC2 domain-containing protein [Actinomadura madurae]MCP9968967.1 zf-HC2 domain-containing protein [Actinomadura madurae]MCP9981439.1 zf-HC2 domain-containing protein [Actinomadura madurae]MCQ0007047.1 zf-HC2 domain-containing protein [Actinomadura madurae]MCQ0017643.1 zf-HC2 domain-containing protein [Actinomadura madurae]